ncbi:MAG: transposase family protein [Gammaproteobacteria bacterium]
MLTNIKSPVTHSIYRADLKNKISVSQKQVREGINAADANIIHRTQAVNAKRSYQTVEEDKVARQDILAEQIKVWRRTLPPLLKKLSCIPDPRRPKSIKHKMVVLMIFGLLAFVFRLSSRREMNRELTGAVINHHLQKIFPELNSIPHADTLARLLKKINVRDIEISHIALIKQLINGKKLKKLLINGCLPITIDGCQKLFRNGLLHDSHWLQRTVGSKESKTDQQYVYAMEANITLKNGLSIPLLTEYLSMENNQLSNPVSKQDCELNAFERLAERLKQHFPRLKIIVFMDSLYATQSVMGILHQCHWEYVINFSKNRLKNFAEILNKQRKARTVIPGQPYYRGRRQEFYWKNNLEHGYDWELRVSLVACLERREEVNRQTGSVEIKYSEHTWISSIPISIDNAHELLNLGARKKEAIEDSINTEKNRGYHYKHLFSHNWNAMRGFHLLMRLGHALNALTQFSKKLKKYVRDNGSHNKNIKIHEKLAMLLDAWVGLLRSN